ncbi:MAG: hypothetical protein QNJ54_02450 [Prochloraceae cyanobacterium]|nr:hypothetical protein [Prochloraceae cyanobacterium]
MRDTSSWAKDIRKALRESDELKEYVESILPYADQEAQNKEIQRLARLITDVELGLTLLAQVAPKDPATSVSVLLLGYRFPFESLQNDANWQKIQNALFYLIRRKGRQWEQCLKEYIQLPETLKIFELTQPQDTPRQIPCTIFPRRWREIYLPTLSVVPPHKKIPLHLAHEGYCYVTIRHRGESVEVPIYIPQAVANLPNSANRASFQRTRQANNPSATVTLEELLEDAQEIDELLKHSGQKPENFYKRLSRVALQLYDANTDDFQPGNKLTLEKLVHIVGLLNVGKSTLLQVLIYHFAKKGFRCALIVNDVVEAVRLAYLFRFGMDIPAVPILGNNRAEQLKKVYEPILQTQGEEIDRGAIHPAWRWFSHVCPLLALVKAEEKWEFGNEPCHNLYHNKDRQQDPDDDDFEDKDKYTCPFYYQCPRHQLEKDIATATVWILTPASLIHTPVPRQVFLERNIRSGNFVYKKVRFAEAVYSECDFLFVDEADRVQVQLDEKFAPDEVLLDNSANSFLNKLGHNISPLYNSNRISMTAPLFKTWTIAQFDAQKAINHICPLLYGNEELVNWLGNSPFTGYSLFARLIGDRVSPQEEEKPAQKQKKTRQGYNKEREEERKQRQQLLETLREFFRHPLNPRKGGKLANIALTALSLDDIDIVLEDIEKWWLDWLNTNEIDCPEKEEFKQLKLQTYFAILIAILDNRLGFLVDNLNEIRQFIDLHDLSEWLVQRPPRDYLPIIPSSPVGNILGFQYTRDRTSKGGKLQYFRYVGVGRALLLNFPTLWAVDNWDGPHTILISGTSYAPGSPAYHIKEKPTVLLEPADNNTAGDVGIRDSKFYLSPQQSDGEYIAISGLKPDPRKEAALKMVKAICNSPGKANNFLDRVFEEIQNLARENRDKWGDRELILLINNSYDEAEWVGSNLKSYYRKNLDEIQILRRDNAPEDLSGIRRGQIGEIKDFPIRVLSAVLMAMERGVNPLNKQGIAAFGAAVFLCRPMPVPDDWQSTVRQLNHWALKHEQDPSFYEIGDKLDRVGDIFYHRAVAKMLELNCRAFGFKQLTPEERSVLCWTQLVSIWQIIGRLVRGGVPCIVHFLDVKFAPQSAEGGMDKETTSLLIGIIKQLEAAMDGQDLRPYEKTLANALYGAFYNALRNTEGLKQLQE